MRPSGQPAALHLRPAALHLQPEGIDNLGSAWSLFSCGGVRPSLTEEKKRRKKHDRFFVADTRWTSELLVQSPPLACLQHALAAVEHSPLSRFTHYNVEQRQPVSMGCFDLRSTELRQLPTFSQGRHDHGHSLAPRTRLLTNLMHRRCFLTNLYLSSIETVYLSFFI